MNVDHRQALNFVVETFDLRVVEIASRSGVNEQQISRFRHGKVDLLAHNYFRLANALQPEHRAVLFGLLQQQSSCDDK